MKSLKRRKQPGGTVIHRHQALRCIPVIHSSIHITKTKNGEFILEYPLLLQPFLHSLLERFQKKPSQPTKKLQLDEMGSVVWQLIDGKNSAQAIITQFAETYGITLEEAEKSVTAFLAELGKRGIIAMK